MTEQRKTADEALNEESKIEDFIASGNTKHRRRKQVRRKRKTKPSLSTPNPTLNRAMSKATIQKTIRFSPELIAQVETWRTQQLESGNQPKSFQQIQQEALADWLRNSGPIVDS